MAPLPIIGVMLIRINFLTADKLCLVLLIPSELWIHDVLILEIVKMHDVYRRRRTRISVSRTSI